MTRASQNSDALIVDASVAAKWQLNDERYAEQARRILRLYREGLLGLSALVSH